MPAKSTASRAVGAARVRPRRDFAALEARRLRAAALFADGRTQAQVAREVKVTAETARAWYQAWRSGGEDALRAAGRAGRPPKLTAVDYERIDTALRQGPRAHGYPSELWTLARVAEVIERLTGVRYHPGHVWRVLKAMGWSRQRPARRSAERDEQAVQTWVKETWPKVKKARGAAAQSSSSKTSRVSRRPR
jgi:transposase